MSETEALHDAQILDQFTRQAIPFSRAESHFTEESLRALAKAVEVNAEDEVLDLACGPGIVSCALAKVAKRVVGTDVVPAMLEEAARRQQREGLHNVEWRIGDATRLPERDQTFSLVVTRYSFHHLLHPADALKEMARVCRPGGRVAVADVTPDADKRAAYDELEKLRDPSHTSALTVDELEALGRDAGLKLLRVTDYRIDNTVDALLGSSFPLEGNADRFRKRVREDVGVNRLSINAYEREGELRFGFPVSIIVWEKR